MKPIKITLIDMADPLKPYAVIQWTVSSLEYPTMQFFTLPATVDARIQHPYAIVVEESDRQ